MPATPRFAERQAAAGGEDAVRFVQGDLHDEAVLAAVGPHDVVWCSGVLYHAPHPILTLERLRAITAPGGTLLLATEVLPVPGRVAVFAPPRWIHPGRPARFDPARGYGNWFWLPSPATVRALLGAAGFAVVEELRTGRWHRTVVARPA
jgi:SAM-dependent methyltransferase